MEQMDFSFMGIIHQMGYLAKLVSVTLVIMSIWSLKVTVDRWLALRTSNKESLGAVREAFDAFGDGNLDGAAAAVRKYPRGHLARVILGALTSFQEDRRRGVPHDFEAADLAVEKERGVISAEMKRGLTSLATISATAPFIGLFGTVVGIINAFTGMAKTGSGGLGAVSGGIAEALITTAFGLFVAIPAVWIYNYFNGRVEGVQTEIDTMKAEVFALVRHGGDGAQAPR